MRRLISSVLRVRYGKLILMAVLLLLPALPVDAYSAYFKNSDEYLYNQAVQSEKKGDWLQVAMYLKAYIERGPARMNTDAAHRGQVNQHLDYAVRRINHAVGLAVEAQKHQQLLQKCTEASMARGAFNNTNPPPPPPLLGSIESTVCTGGRPGPNQVMLFMHFDYQPPCVVKGIGRYDTAEQIGLPNDSISSIRVGGNVRAVLCRDGGSTGTCGTFLSDDPNLSDSTIGNDQATSARIEWR